MGTKGTLRKLCLSCDQQLLDTTVDWSPHSIEKDFWVLWIELHWICVLNPSHNISFYGEGTVNAHGTECVLYFKSVVKIRDSILIKVEWKDLQAAILVNS